MEIFNVNLFLLLFSLLMEVRGSETFTEKYKTYEEHSGRTLTVSTHGRLRNIIDLDDKSIVAKTMCRDALIKVSLVSMNSMKDWKIGDVVIASAVLGCRLAYTKQGDGVLGKILDIEIKRKGLIYLKVEQASPLDILEEVDVSLHAKHRTKRSNSNFLSNILDSINWDEVANTTVVFNPERNSFSLLKMANNPEPEVRIYNSSSQDQMITGTHFNFTCSSCFGTIDLSYHLEMRIRRDQRTNKPIITSYLSQIEGEVSNNYQFTVESQRELTLKIEKELLRSGPLVLHPIQLATFKRFPPIHLAINVHSITTLFANVIMKSSKEVKIDDAFQTSGKFVVSNIHSQNIGEHPNYVSTYDWLMRHSAREGMASNDSFSINITISQEIFIKPFIEWRERDIRFDFGSPFTVRLNQELDMTSSVADVSLCANVASRITGVFSTGINSLVVDAFGISIWGEVSKLSKARATSVSLLQQNLSNKCRANCFGFQQLMTTSMDVCGSPKVVVLRNSSMFSTLRKLFGNAILFLSEESNESSWCGHPGNPCTDCDDYFQDNNVCSDRYVTPNLAEVLTKLVKFIAAEWPGRKLLILEAWDEPTSTHPHGSHGNQSLFYSGRAARIALSKNLASKEPETDRLIFRRFEELLKCSDVDYFETFLKDSVVDICVADDSSSLFTNQNNRRKKRAVKSNNIVKVNTWKEDKDKFNDYLFSLVTAKTLGSTFKDYFGSGKYHPKNKTAEEVCGKADEEYSADNLDQMQRLIQYPLENVEFEAEGPKTSSCGSETRGCNQCKNYTDVDNPWDWCLTRAMTTRAATRLRRLVRIIEDNVQSPSKRSRRSTNGMSDEELGICRSGVTLFQTLEGCQKLMNGTDKRTKCYKCIKDARCCYGNEKIGCMKSFCSGVESSSVWDRITCTEPNPMADGVSIPLTPACNQGDSSKIILYGNVCSGDPCQFFTGKEYNLLLKVILIFEVCSSKWNQKTMDSEIQSLTIKDKDLMTTLTWCMAGEKPILKLHYPDEDENDPTIGIGYSLLEKYGSTEKKDFLLETLPGLDYGKIMSGTQGITKEQAIFLFDRTIRRFKIKSINKAVPFATFVHLDTATKIALINANYRGEFKEQIKSKFASAVSNGQWANAAAIYLKLDNFIDNKCSTTGKGSICTRMKWNAEQFKKHITRPVVVSRTDLSSKTGSSSKTLAAAGRSLKISVNTGVSLTNSKLANLAVLAGFDHVTKESDHIIASVRAAAGVNTVIVNYPNLNMHETEPPVKDMIEYEIPAEADYSLTYPILVDGFNASVNLSDCYRIEDIKSNDFRYFRFDEKLLECLEDASSHSEGCIKVISGSGYRVRSDNNRNIDSRHTEEKWRFSVGQAVEVGQGMNQKQLYKLGLTIMRSCVQNLIPKRLILGIGVHSDRLYVDIRESTSTEEFVKIWDHGFEPLYKDLKDIETGFKHGGAFIQPTNRTRACQPPPLGSNAYYIKYSKEGECDSDSGASSECSKTSSTRKKAASDFLERLMEVAGNGPLDKATLRSKVNKCLVDLCGGCIGKGKVWKDKTIACFDLMIYFLNGSSSPFPDLRNTGAFYNTENTKSEVHSLACHDGSACLENVQLHSFLQETLATKYKPDSAKTNEELVYDPVDNPSPLPDILEQEMAMRVAGNVSVYIESSGDVSKLNHLLKILMIYNLKVTNVQFHLTKSVRENQVMSAIQRKLERWSYSACPDRSRIVVAPYTVHKISHERHRRSIERSEERNIVKRLRNNWELEWLAQT
ncbi:uncharacterized protein LOC134249705 [Saccostrea cucullata]|uniref:uncharacterized protein LOC134249705 n=1 Tax=Saccostrea cuccullata TaxID=36930 RepID=UPI002ED61010